MQKSSKYFIKYEGAILLNSFKTFKRKISPWVYVYLKNTFYYDIIKNPLEPKRINRSKLIDFFQISTRRITYSLDDLEKNELISKISKDHYYIVDESNYIEKCRSSLVERIDTKKVFFQMKYNFFFKYYPLITNVGFSLYYYMMILNQHYLSPTKDTVLIPDNYFSIKRFCKEMNFTHRTVEPIIEKMTELDIILFDQFGRYYTNSEKKILSSNK